MTLQASRSYSADRVSRLGSHAIVVGAGIGGLLASRILADAYDRVTIVERDALPASPTPRRGIPQSRHVHALLEAGRAALDDLCPGFCASVESRDGVTIDAATEFGYFHGGAFLADGPERLPMLCASRPLFEHVLRTHVDDLDGVSIRSPAHCKQFRLNEAGTKVNGVDFVGPDGIEKTMDGDLVVDATGRASRTPRWLAQHGYSPPPEATVNIDLAYSTVEVQRPPGEEWGTLIAPSRDSHRGGTIVPIEGNRWLVTLFGLHGDHPPTDSRMLKEFASTLPTPTIEDLLDSHRIVGDGVEHYPFAANRWRQYDELSRFPDGLVVIGDAVASFNPIYGQGMSVAALDALELHYALAAGSRNLPKRYFDRISNVIATVWRMAVCVDFQFDETVGDKPRGTAVFNWYLSRVIQAAHTDGTVTDALARVLRLERSPKALLGPRIAARALRPF